MVHIRNHKRPVSQLLHFDYLGSCFWTPLVSVISFQFWLNRFPHSSTEYSRCCLRLRHCPPTEIWLLKPTSEVAWDAYGTTEHLQHEGKSILDNSKGSTNRNDCKTLWQSCFLYCLISRSSFVRPCSLKQAVQVHEISAWTQTQCKTDI